MSDQIVPLQLVMGLARHNPSNLFLPVVGDREVARVVSSNIPSNIPSNLPLLGMFNKVEPKLLLRAVIYWVRIVVITFFRHAVR